MGCGSSSVDQKSNTKGKKKNTANMKFGGIEAGGTKFVVAVGDDQGNIKNRESFPTTTPQETTQKIIEYFTKNPVDAVGLGAFGPIDPDPSSKTFGYITTTPKPGWANFNIVGELKKGLNNIPVGFDTDVNAACLGEIKYGAAKGLDSALYLTIGTGVGGGAFVEGNLVHGLLHPEMGHMRLVKRSDDNYEGHCPFHKGCLEGLTAGPAVGERWGKKGAEIPEDHEAWDLEGYYIGQACASFVLILSPKKIILGGGVMHKKNVLPAVHKYTKEFLNDYIQKDEVTKNIDSYIILPGLGDNAGIVGSIALAVEAV
jgi:fructokinase